MLSLAHHLVGDGSAAELQLRLDGALNIATVAQARGELLQALASAPGAALRLDTRGVTEADSAGAQLLVATAAQLARDGRRAGLLPPPAPLARVLRTLGLGDDQGCTGYAPVPAGADA
jgi:anti-anti-sigma regulatory factor